MQTVQLNTRKGLGMQGYLWKVMLTKNFRRLDMNSHGGLKYFLIVSHFGHLSNACILKNTKDVSTKCS